MEIENTANYLKSLRLKKGLTQEEVANLLNVSNKTVSKWETGSGLPEIHSLMALSKLYEVTVDMILNGGKISKVNIEHSNTEDDNLTTKQKERYSIHSIISLGIALLAFIILIIITNQISYNELLLMIPITLSVLSIIYQVLIMIKINNCLKDKKTNKYYIYSFIHLMIIVTLMILGIPLIVEISNKYFKVLHYTIALILIVIPLLTIVFIRFNKIKLKFYKIIFIILIPIIALMPFLIDNIFPNLFKVKEESVVIVYEKFDSDRFNDLYVFINIDSANIVNDHYEVYDSFLDIKRIISSNQYETMKNETLKDTKDLKIIHGDGSNRYITYLKTTITNDSITFNQYSIVLLIELALYIPSLIFISKRKKYS